MNRFQLVNSYSLGDRTTARSAFKRNRNSSWRRATIQLAAALFIPLAVAQDASAPAATITPEAAEVSTRAARGLLLDVAYTGERLVAVGERGNVVASKDGHRWAQAKVPSNSTLTAVSFADAKLGWAVGHDSSILHTTDGGKTWVVQRFQPEGSQPLLDVLFVSPTRGYAVGAFGMFFVTDDGGGNWNELDAPSIREDGLHFHALTRLADGSLLVVGERGLLGWSADGNSWERLASPYEGTFFGATPNGASGAVVFGLRGNTFIADDTRANAWRKVELGSTRTAFGGAALRNGTSAISGADGLLTLVSSDGSAREIGRQPIVGDLRKGTLNSVVSWPGGLLAVGEVGIQLYSAE